MTIDTKRIAADDAGAPGEDDPMKAAIELSLFDRAPFSPEDLVDTIERQQRGIETQLTWLQLATRSYDIEFWIFEPQANVLKIYFIDDEGVLQKRVFEDMPDSAIQAGMVHPESASSVRRLFDGIRSGAPHGGATARVRHHGHPSYEWCALSFRLVGSGRDSSPRAIGICRDLETPNRPGPDRSPSPDSLYPI